MSREDPDVADTRARLLVAAERLFAEKGFADTSIRDITRLADANVAAINYHFGNKQGLYLAVFRARAAEMAVLRETALRQACNGDPAADLETTLRAFVGACLPQMLSGGAGECFPQLIFREMAAPGPAFEYLLENFVEPNIEGFRRVIQRVRPELSHAQAALCVASVFGQMLHFVRARRIIERVTGRPYDAAFVDEVCEHVVRFSVAGIQGGGT